MNDLAGRYYRSAYWSEAEPTLAPDTWRDDLRVSYRREDAPG